MYQVKSPILFLIFNRPKETQLLFNAIKEAKPKKLYVAADGPRNNGKDELVCMETKDVLKQIDWDCELITLFRDENLGCGKAVSSAISWFFDNEEEGIILEDDCLPSTDFFRFTDEMLERYRNDSRVGHINGCSFQDGQMRGEGDYCFSKLYLVWGWASWRRVWDKYDFNLSGLNIALKEDVMSNLTDCYRFKEVYYDSFIKTESGLIDTWDYQYNLSNLLNGYLSILPNYNMITNIGFNNDGTHTFDSNSPMSNIPFDTLPLVLLHPKYIYQNRNADNYILEKAFGYKPSIKEIIKMKLYKFRNLLIKNS
jgi:hypothetical protein